MVACLPLDLMGLPAVPPGEPFPPLHPPFPRVPPSLPPNTGRLSVASLEDALLYVKPWWAFSFVGSVYRTETMRQLSCFN